MSILNDLANCQQKIELSGLCARLFYGVPIPDMGYKSGQLCVNMEDILFAGNIGG